MDKREQEFDAEIRRKLSEGSIDFDEAAWDKMERKLAAGAGKPRMLPMWLRAAAAVLLAGLVVWGYRSYFGNEDGERLAGKADGRETSLPQEERPGSTENDPENTAGIAGGDKGKNTSEGSGAGEVRSTAAVAGPKAASGSSAGQGTHDGLPAKTGPASTGPASPEEIIATRGLSRSRIGLTDKGRMLDAGITQEEGMIPDERLSRLEMPALHRGMAPPAGRDDISSAQTEDAVPDGESRRRAGKVRREKNKIAFSLSVLAAPDLNGVKGFNGGKVGFNTGLGLGIHFTDRLSLQTGVIYSKKPYNAAPGDYHTGYSPQGLVNIAADCDVIDIPLNLQYQLYRKGLNSISVNAGLSSYLMLREEYQYEYGNYDPRSYEYRNENRHFMGVGNAGVTLERKVSDNMSIGLQPFIKVPLTGIGHGNVRLISAGAAIQLNLDLGKKTKPNK